MFLTADELRELTGYQLPAKQAKWLRERGFCFEVGADGRPRVLRTHVERKMGGSETPKKTPTLRL